MRADVMFRETSYLIETRISVINAQENNNETGKN